MSEWDRYATGNQSALSDEVFARLLRQFVEARDRGEVPPRPDARVTRDAARAYAAQRGFGHIPARPDGATQRLSLSDEGIALLRAHGFK